MLTFTLRKRIQRGKLLQAGWLIVIAVLSITASSAWAGDLVRDDFNGSTLAPIWRLHQGYASVQGGWVILSGSTPGTRGGYIVTGEGSTWSDYHLSTRAIVEGGGEACDQGPPCAWYVAMIKVRVQTLSGDNRGTYYEVEMWTPPSEVTTGRGASVGLLKVVNDEVSVVREDLAPPGVINDYDNRIDIEAIGTRIRVYVNDQLITDYTDQSANPIMTGGVSLGALWESTCRYDYIYVQDSGIPFAAFTARASMTLGPEDDDYVFKEGKTGRHCVRPRDDSFSVSAKFRLGANSDGIDPVSENVGVKFGSFSTTIPAGKFRQQAAGLYRFEGTIDGVGLKAQIHAPQSRSGRCKHTDCWFNLRATGAHMDDATVCPIVQLTIGDDTGQANLDVGKALWEWQGW